MPLYGKCYNSVIFIKCYIVKLKVAMFLHYHNSSCKEKWYNNGDPYVSKQMWYTTQKKEKNYPPNKPDINLWHKYKYRPVTQIIIWPRTMYNIDITNQTYIQIKI